ncbi:MAG TPA: type I-C CRISPR-associated protein Cas7/Csd2 [Clostridiaceae bacterium]|nr:type I-C CRISPR-associated protein Cas7/Csd2 [Clostridiaceae bacterium]
MSDIIKNRYEFVILFDVLNGNPNGDPDAGNMPRIDPETGYGIVTDVCLKRKIRDYVDIVKSGDVKYKIYVKSGTTLDVNRKWAYESCKVEPPRNNKGEVTAEEPSKEEFKRLTSFMCYNFYDIRTFGAVMTLKYNCGQVRGPVQLGFARSIDVITQQEVGITSVTYANEGEKSSKMGRKQIVPYALYRVEGYVSANLAKKTGFSEQDLELLWEAIINMFEHDRSAARGNMSTRELIVFKHQSEFGNCPAYKLFDTIVIKRKDENKPPRSFNDYDVIIDKTAIPPGVEMIRMI